MTSQFVAGDLVLAKFPGYPPWPAKVIDHPEGRHKRNFYYVFFYGSENHAWIKEDHVCSFHYDLLCDQLRNNDYNKAVKEAKRIFNLKFLLGDEYEDFMQRLQAREDEEKGKEKTQNSVKVQKNVKKKKRRTNLNKKHKKTSKSEAASSIHSIPSSHISTVPVHEYRRLISREIYILVRRCDQDIPSLTDCHVSIPYSHCQQHEQPPILSPEM